MRKHRELLTGKWVFVSIGFCVFTIAAVVCEYLGTPRYIRGFTLFGCVVTVVIYVTFESFATRVWYWMTVIAVTAVHALLLVAFADAITRASSALTIPLGMLDGFVFIIIIVLVAARFERREGSPRRRTTCRRRRSD
jgi:hypothetical protein